MEPGSSSSPKSSVYTYFIQSHGEIVTLPKPYTISRARTFIALQLANNVEILTYSSLGEQLLGHCQTINMVCNKQKKTLFAVDTPVYKYRNEFPDLYLTPDIPDPINGELDFYSGIVHCIPKSRKDSSSKKEIIHNMDADPYDCGDDSIHPYYNDLGEFTQLQTPIIYRPYNSTNKYSKDYIKILEKKRGSKREPPLQNINKCGPLYLKEAIEIIMEHCKATYPHNYADCIIQIHVAACLVLSESTPNYSQIDSSLKIVNNLDYFHLRSVSDPLIKDTSTSIYYSYTFYDKIFRIYVPKPKLHSYKDPYPLIYYDSLKDALHKLPRETFELLPNEIIISIPEAHTMTKEAIKKYITHNLVYAPKRRRSNTYDSRKKSRITMDMQMSKSLQEERVLVCMKEAKTLSSKEATNTICVVQGGKKKFIRRTKRHRRTRRTQRHRRTRRTQRHRKR